MTAYLIDTDRIIDVLHGDRNTGQLLVDLELDGVAISLITYGELYEGVHYGPDREDALIGLQDFLSDKEIVSLSTEIMERFAIIRGQLNRHDRRQIGDMDLLIAATAVHHDLTLVTRNRRHFQLVPGLRLFDEGEVQRR